MPNIIALTWHIHINIHLIQGRGSYLYDETGRAYLDTRNNVCHVGHQNPHVVRRTQEQIATLNTNSRYLHPNGAILAQRLASLLPDPLSVVFFVNSGSEANDLALRLARAKTGSKNTIVVDGAYHGHTLATLEVSPYKYEHSKEYDGTLQPQGMKSRYNPRFKTPGRHIWKVPCPDGYRGSHRGNTAPECYAEYVKEACRYYQEDCGESVSAFLIEGGMSVGGVILPPPTYLKRCVGHVRSAGGLYIADEVQTGFGRLGSSFWGFQHGGTNVIPDIVTVGKGFGNSMPLAAVITTPDVSKAFESMDVEYFNTFGGNPVSTAAGLAVLDVIDEQSLDCHASDVGDYLRNGFLQLQCELRKNDRNIIGDVRGSGLFLGLDLIRDEKTLEPAKAETSFICSILKEKYAILTSIDGPNENVIVIKPPMVFSRADSDKFLACFKAVVTEDLATMDLTTMSKTPT